MCLCMCLLKFNLEYINGADINFARENKNSVVNYKKRKQGTSLFVNRKHSTGKFMYIFIWNAKAV